MKAAYLFGLVSVFCTFVNCESFLPHDGYVYFDLTELIDKTLISSNVSDKEDLKTFLDRSPLVLYRSDMLLSNIENILPIIDLLQQLKTDERPPQIILSLRYFNRTNGHFNWERLGDIYYKLKSNLTTKDKARIVSSVIAIALDFDSGHNFVQDFYDSVSYLTEISFPSYVKNFIKFYFGHNVIPVAVMYGEEKINGGYTYDISRHILSADFVIFCAKFSGNNDFPMFMEALQIAVANKLNLNTQYLHGIFYGKPSRYAENVLLMMKIIDNFSTSESLYPYYSSGDHYSTFNDFMKTTASYNGTSKLFLENANNKAPNKFSNIAVQWAMLEGQTVIISNPHQNISSESWKEPRRTKRHPLIIPFIQIQETNMTLCEMKANLSVWREQHDAVVVDEKTWRTFSRFQQELEGDSYNCNSSGKVSESTVSSTLNGILNFPVNVGTIWSKLETYVTEILTDFPKIFQISLETLMFDEEDIRLEQIQKFLNVSKENNFSIGCSLSFNGFRRQYDSYTISFKENIEKNLCPPLFHSMNYFIWRVEDVHGYGYYYGGETNFKTSGLFSTYSDIFLAREVFMKEYPGKNVIIQFDSERDKKIIAEMYNVPIVVPVTQIRYK